jgi:hypothetical protein
VGPNWAHFKENFIIEETLHTFSPPKHTILSGKNIKKFAHRLLLTCRSPVNSVRPSLNRWPRCKFEGTPNIIFLCQVKPMIFLCKVKPMSNVRGLGPGDSRLLSHILRMSFPPRPHPCGLHPSQSTR